MHELENLEKVSFSGSNNLDFDIDRTVQKILIDLELTKDSTGSEFFGLLKDCFISQTTSEKLQTIVIKILHAMQNSLENLKILRNNDPDKNEQLKYTQNAFQILKKSNENIYQEFVDTLSAEIEKKGGGNNNNSQIMDGFQDGIIQRLIIFLGKNQGNSSKLMTSLVNCTSSKAREALIMILFEPNCNFTEDDTARNVLVTTDSQDLNKNKNSLNNDHITNISNFINGSKKLNQPWDLDTCSILADDASMALDQIDKSLTGILRKLEKNQIDYLWGCIPNRKKKFPIDSLHDDEDDKNAKIADIVEYGLDNLCSLDPPTRADCYKKSEYFLYIRNEQRKNEHYVQAEAIIKKLLECGVAELLLNTKLVFTHDEASLDNITEENNAKKQTRYYQIGARLVAELDLSDETKRNEVLKDLWEKGIELEIKNTDLCKVQQAAANAILRIFEKYNLHYLDEKRMVKLQDVLNYSSEKSGRNV